MEPATASAAPRAEPTPRDGPAQDAAGHQKRPAAARRWRPIAHRSTVWTDSRTAEACTPSELLASVPNDVRRIYLTGPRPGGTLEAFTEWAHADPGPEWTVDPAGHHIDVAMLPVLRWKHRDGRRVEVHRAATWLGEGDYTPAAARAAMRLFAEGIAAAWRADIAWLSTPATTGRDLLLRSLPEGETFPCLDDEHQELIRATSGQGRWQLRNVGDELPGLEVWDARLAYAALAWGVGCGPATRDAVPEYVPYARGRYRVTATVPDGWDHVGLLGVPDDDGGWDWPEQPGRTFTAWCDGAELAVALDAGWPVTIHERLLWRDGRPLDVWARRLVAVRDRLAQLWRDGEHDRDVCQLAAGAVRRVLLTTIGAVHGRPHRITRSAPIAEARAVPEHATDVRMVGDRLVWREDRAQRWRDLAHPEWSSTVWARCRARMLLHRRAGTGALTVPASTVLAIRQDAVYLTRPPTSWPADDGKVGRMRREHVIAGPLRAPRNVAELLALKGEG